MTDTWLIITLMMIRVSSILKRWVTSEASKITCFMARERKLQMTIIFKESTKIISKNPELSCGITIHRKILPNYQIPTKLSFRYRPLEETGLNFNISLFTKENSIKINNSQDKVNSKTQMVCIKASFSTAKNMVKGLMFLRICQSTLGSTKTIKNKDMANFTTVILPWPMKGFGKIIFLTVKGNHMA